MAWESWEKPKEDLGEALGLEILGEARENLENLGTLGVPLGLEIQGKPGKYLLARKPWENLGKM